MIDNIEDAKYVLEIESKIEDLARQIRELEAERIARIPAIGVYESQIIEDATRLIFGYDLGFNKGLEEGKKVIEPQQSIDIPQIQ